MLRTARSRRAHDALTTARWWKGGGETLYFTATAATVTALLTAPCPDGNAKRTVTRRRGRAVPRGGCISPGALYRAHLPRRAVSGGCISPGAAGGTVNGRPNRETRREATRIAILPRPDSGPRRSARGVSDPRK